MGATPYIDGLGPWWETHGLPLARPNLRKCLCGHYTRAAICESCGRRYDDDE